MAYTEEANGLIHKILQIIFANRPKLTTENKANGKQLGEITRLTMAERRCQIRAISDGQWKVTNSVHIMKGAR